MNNIARDRPVRAEPRRLITALPLAALLVVSLVAMPAAAQTQQDANDPLEGLNRNVFGFNLFIDELLLEPLALTYRLFTPPILRTGVSNFLDNLGTPVVVVNSLLQGEPRLATEAFGRFMFNTILGFGGLIDVGGKLGMPPRHREDFGQTLAVYGVGSGPYLMVPLLGPSNPRDVVGRVADYFLDPFSMLAPTEATTGRTVANAVTFREENIENFDELQRTSIDFYAASRTLYQQYRDSEIRNGTAAPLDDNIYNDDIYNEDIYEEDLDELEDPASDGGL